MPIPALCFASALLALPLGAQDKGKDGKAASTVPTAAMPPAGLCRVWLEGVPALRQPAPTDCATAIRNRPPRATVLFGDRRGERASPWPARSTSPGATSHALDSVGRSRSSTVTPPGAVIRPSTLPAKPTEKPPEKPLY